MKSADLPNDEIKRLNQLSELEILDTIEELAYDDLTKIAAHVCDAPISLVSLIDKDRQWFKSHYGLEARETPREFAFCAHAILQDQIFEIKDSFKDDRFHDNPLVTGDPKVVFYAGYPLNVNGNKIGTLCVIDNKPKSLSSEQLEVLTCLGRQVEAQLQLRLLNKNLRKSNNMLLELSSIDPLTNLANRRTLFESLDIEFKKSAREDKPLSIIITDVDYFKSYNDHYGHIEGDSCLRKVSEQLKSNINRPGDVVGRYGGEEFMFILPNTDENTASTISQKIIDSMNELNIKHDFSSCDNHITVSCGVASNKCKSLERPEELISRADKALYAAKTQGRNRTHTYLD